MAKKKIAITLEEKTLRDLDQLVKKGVFRNRSNAFQQAISEKLERSAQNRLARESAKLNSREEQALAEESILAELDEWPEY